MLLTLIILYVITLVYVAMVERFRSYASIIAFQGWILLGIALLRLHSLNWVELSFVILETLIFKAIIVPGPCRFFGLWGRRDDYVIPWRCIKKMGPDIVLVDVQPDECRVPRHKPGLLFG